MNFVSTKNKARRRKKKKAGKGREVYYLENTAMADSTNDIEICTVTSHSLPAETSPIKQKANQMTASTECIASSSVCGRERTWSRSSAAPVLHSTDFWDRHFDGTNSVSWKTFRAAFLDDYGCVIQEFAPQRIHWILTIVHKDIFAAANDIHKLYYDKFCGKSRHPDRLWVNIKQYAAERIFREGVIESMFE